MGNIELNRYDYGGTGSALRYASVCGALKVRVSRPLGRGDASGGGDGSGSGSLADERAAVVSFLARCGWQKEQ